MQEKFLAVERGPSEEDLSPCTSPETPAAEGSISIRPSGQSESAIDDEESSVGNSPHQFNRIDTFDFPHDETTTLIRRSSHSSSTIARTGESTVPQTIFNSMNTLIGIGMLSLPFGFRLSGWIFGTIILASSSYITGMTAKMLGRILKRYPSLNSYGDIAEQTGHKSSIGSKTAHYVVTAIFIVDLLGALVELVILFGDSFFLLYPQIPKPAYKAILILASFCLSFLSLSTLSFLSLLGLLCTNALIVILIICGFFTSNSPGSLLHPSATSWWPKSAMEVFMSLGIFMAPWGGHPVFPELYRDMRHPLKYPKVANTSFFLVFDLNYLVAVAGYLMFGSQCEDSITKNLMSNANFPSWVTPAICILMGLLPISKIPLLAKPVVNVYESYFHLGSSTIVVKNGQREENYSTGQIVSRMVFFAFMLAMSLVFTSFGKVLAFLGSAVVFTMCMTCPLLFYLVLMKDQITSFQRTLLYIGVAVGFVCSVVGTIASISIVT
ncbi:hypothetical protein QA089_002199 [Meyerozyma guilliermondii]